MCARKQLKLVVLEAEERSSKGRDGQKLYRKGKQTGHREREQKQEFKIKGVEENEEKQQQKKIKKQLQNILVLVTLLYVN